MFIKFLYVFFYMITIVTSNKNKFKEIKEILGKIEDVENIAIDLIEIQGSAEEIIKHKAKEAFSIIGKPCIVEDVSFELEEWNGFPGPYIKHLLAKIGSEGIFKAIEGKNMGAKAICTIGYAKSSDEIIVVKGEVSGKIVSPSKDNGFGFDLIFVPDGFDKTYSEMTLEEKNKISHRRKALEELKKVL